MKGNVIALLVQPTTGSIQNNIHNIVLMEQLLIVWSRQLLN